MYLEFFGLNRHPFKVAPEPGMLYPSPCHKEALAAIIHGIETRKGFVVVTGDVGTGKTTTTRAYLDGADPERFDAVYLFNPNIDFGALLKFLCRELRIRRRSGNTDADMVEKLQRRLISEYSMGINVALIIDEAQNIPVDTLENLRMLSNLETAGDKLIQIILVGQPELRALLGRHELRQVRQRVAIWAELRALSKEESLNYIEYRLNQASSTSTALFSPQALRKIVRAARGVPRTINMLCESALVTAFGYQEPRVSGRTAREVIRDAGLRAGRFRPFRFKFGAIVGILGSCLLAEYAVPSAQAASGEVSQQTMVDPSLERGPLATWHATCFDNSSNE